ncbi:calcium-activated chloride channel regulator 1-like [Diadema antillarum]|uniref:calcium-activated chloride channel regulator 1-like n=1 Tax=Diadema antillarum TaxID=105358 RepID=UPI003A8384CD
MVREWGRLRWSLFPEHFTGSGNEDAEANQYEDWNTGLYQPTRCSLAVTGDMRDEGGSKCDVDPLEKVKEDDCVFIPYSSDQDANASLLFGSHCVDSAANLHNYHCRRWSAWEVMESTEDFFEENFADPNLMDTEPSFTILQQPVRRVVLALDFSSSMGASFRVDKLIQSASIFIRHYIPAGSHLGIVTFDDSATVNADLTLVQDDDSSREDLVNALPTAPYGSSCIGCGIEAALSVLGNNTNGSYILVLSDGEENRSPFIRDTIPAAVADGVVIDTIAVTNDADEQMENLTSITGGKPFFCPDEGSSACLTEAFLSTVSERPELNFIPSHIQVFLQ